MSVSMGAAGCHEDDRHTPGALIAAHQFCQLEAIEARHLHVDKGERHIVLQKQLKRLIAGARLQKDQTLAA
jgi:hypothetical protein